MKRIRVVVCILLTLGIAWLPLFADELDTERAEIVRTGMTIAVAGIGLAAGSAIAIGFSLDAINTPLSNLLLLTIPVAAAGAASGALAGRWIADTALKHHPSPLFSVIEGAGLGLAAGAFVGAITFSTNFAIAFPLLEVPEGYWGRFEYLQAVGMSIISGGVWGGIFGAMAGAVVLPVISLVMGF